MSSKIKSYLPILLFFNIAGWYLKNLAPTIFGGDAPELLTSSYNLGVAHPTGYPLFTILFKLASFLPLSSPAVRANFFNSLITASAILLFFLLLKKRLETLPSVIASLMLALSYTLFGEALISRVYPLNILASTLILYLLILENPKYLPLTVFLAGTALTNHYFTLLLLPLLLLSSMSFHPFLSWHTSRSNPLKYYLLSLVLFLVGLSLYLYLPIRAGRHPFPNWETPYNLKYFWNTIAQSSYRFKMANRGLKNIRTLLWLLAKSYCLEFYIIGTLLSLYGFIKSFRVMFIRYLFLIPLGNLLMVVSYGSREEFYSLYFLPTFLVGAIYLGLGLKQVFSLIKRQRVFILSSIWLLFLLFGWGLYWVVGQEITMKHNYLFYDYASNVLNNPPAGSKLIVNGDYVFPLWYIQRVEDRHLDISILIYPVNSWSLREMAWEDPVFLFLGKKSLNALKFLENYLVYFQDTSPIYATFILETKIPKQFYFRRTLVLDQLTLTKPDINLQAERISLVPPSKFWRSRIIPDFKRFSSQQTEMKLRHAYFDFYVRLRKYYHKRGEFAKATEYEQESKKMLFR